MNGNGTTSDFSVSIVASATDTAPREEKFRTVLAGIAAGEWKQAVETIRRAHAEKGKEASDPLKKRLPGVMFSGVFSYRSATKLVAHSGLICVDLDHVENLEAVRESIVADPHTLACFISPTGTGLKVVFRVDPQKSHFESYRAAEHFVHETFGLEIDSACSDVSRLCFVSYDPDAFAAADATVLPYPEPLAEITEPVEPSRTRVNFPAGHISPGDDYDARGDWRGLLRSARRG